MNKFWKILGISKKNENLESLRLKIDRFRVLLKENNRVLDLFADAEEKLSGDFLFDSQYIIDLSGQLEESVQRVIHSLSFITATPYMSLLRACEEVSRRVNEIVDKGFSVPNVPYVLTLEQIRRDKSDAVGAKMARLGVLKNELSLNTPDGFVITSAMCYALFKMLNLEEEITNIVTASNHDDIDDAYIEDRLNSKIVSARLSKEMKKTIKKNVNELKKKYNHSMLFALRSSAIGEDGAFSYAGLHDSHLCVPDREIIPNYLRVLGSTFSARSIAYRKVTREPLASALMAVGCLQMIPAKVSGVLYTMNPYDYNSEEMVISAAYGLGKTVVEGRDLVDQFIVSRDPPHHILSCRIGEKKWKYHVGADGTLEKTRVEPEARNKPCITDSHIQSLVCAALRIEHHMRSAQDIEWLFDADDTLYFLQTRPLTVDNDLSMLTRPASQPEKKHSVLLADKGTISCRGIAFGTVVIIENGESVDTLPQNAVLVARYSSPQLIERIPEAVAIITDIGLPTGHLGTITRELRIPSIMNVGNATEILQNGMKVTVDAEENIVYLGRVEELVKYQMLRTTPFDNSEEFRKLKRILKTVTPLNLVNPHSKNFVAKNCRSYHDIIRFAHEKAVEFLSSVYVNCSDKNSEDCKKIVIDLPLDLKVIDLTGGQLLGSETNECGLDDLKSNLLKALLHGIMAKGIWSQKPAEMDLESFMASVTAQSPLNGSTIDTPMPNLAIISPHYLNVNLFLGYHYNQVDAYVSEDSNDNYLMFRFSGGVTNLERRSRRIRMISKILAQLDFLIDIKGDFIIARLKKFDQKMMLNRLKIIGLLIAFTRQMDVRMKNDAMVDQGVMEFFNKLKESEVKELE